MARTFKLKVYTPAGVLFEDNITQASIHSSEGWISLLANHAPLIGSFTTSHFYVRDEGSNKVDTIISDGIFEFDNNTLNLFTNFFAFTKEINENAFKRIENELNEALERQKAMAPDPTINAINNQLKNSLNQLKKISGKR